MAGFISNFFGVGDSDSQYEEPTEASQAAAPSHWICNQYSEHAKGSSNARGQVGE